MNIRIRPAVSGDVPVILDIMNEAIIHTTSVYEYTPRPIEVQQAWFEKKQADAMPVLVAVNEEEVLGYGTYDVFRPRAAYRFTVEHSVYVAAPHRGLGIGAIILKALIHKALEEGYHTMIAGIDAANKGSIAFHRKYGFEEVGLLREVGYKFDRWLDLQFMQLILNRPSASQPE
jgi:L-amino acid N-acyltransferase